MNEISYKKIMSSFHNAFNFSLHVSFHPPVAQLSLDPFLSLIWHQRIPLDAQGQRVALDPTQAIE